MFLETEPGLHVVGEACNRAAALPAATREQPDVVLLDLDLGEESGLDLIGDLRDVVPQARILALTSARDAEAHRRAIHLGTAGVVAKEATAEVLIKAIRKISVGEGCTSTAGAFGAHEDDPEAAKISKLSAREHQVIALIGEGLNNRRIAERLLISETTVRHHLTSIFSKLEIHDRLRLLLYAFRHKLVKLTLSSSS